MREEKPSAVRSLYVHVPFCAQKCEYCAFYSTSADGELVNRYVDALTLEIEGSKHALSAPLDTVFFGGGTPSLLNLKQWQRVFDAFAQAGLIGASEWTVECNPATVSADKARLFRDFGINRVSMGVQSLDEGLLDRLGRVHSRDMVFRSFDTLRAAGFQRINIDLMFGIPGQTMDIWRSTLAEALAMGSEHLSCYEVIYEEDTPLFEQLQAGEIDVDEELQAAMFDVLVDESGAQGFHQYEIANFARHSDSVENPSDAAGAAGFLPSEACRHNVNYWRGGAYVALGPSASGYVGGRRYRNVANTRMYCERVERRETPVDWSEALSPIARAGEIAAFGLRMNAGWGWNVFRDATGWDLRQEWGATMDETIRNGWGTRDELGFRLTRGGLRFADTIGAEFLRPEPAAHSNAGSLSSVRPMARLYTSVGRS